MFPRDIFRCDIAAPCSAAESHGEGHPIVVVSAVSIALGLTNHHSAYMIFHGKFKDVLIICRMNAA